jgi:hypothetical protein
MKDYDRHENLRNETRKRQEATQKKIDEERRKRLEKKGIDQKSLNYDLHRYHDSIYTMGNDEATILYIIVMLVAIIFKDRVLIWIVATLVYYLHITRHNRR